MAICRDVVENIVGFIDAELDDETLRALEEHIEECPECTEFVKTYRMMLRLTGKLRERTFVTQEVRERLKELLRSKIKPNA
jgi:anti-sigma factor RsiW